ncbi:MAG: peptidoglycan D,D-transpeptidase FtsI family protein [Thermodesulfobacteriota bacterium]
MNTNAREKQQIANRNRRITIVGVVFTFCFMVIGLKAAYLQVIAENDLSQRASSEYCRAVENRGKRGTIYDVKSREMVVSTDVISVGAHPEQIQNPKKTARAIGEIIAVETGALADRLASDKTFVWVKRDVAPDKADPLSRAVPDGLEIMDSFCRVYPNKTLAGQVLGFAGVDGNGLEGLEYYYDDYLKGGRGEQTIIKDALGRIFQRSAAQSPPTRGKNVVLTLDANIQYIAENALEKAVFKYRAKSAMAVVMVPDTGAIRAIAHYPAFNPNNYSLSPRNAWRNRVITNSFEPGSTMKVFTAAAALASGQCRPQTVVDCEDGQYKVAANTIHDPHPHELLTLHEVIKYSSNIGAAKIADRIGPQILYDTLRNFGFGEKTGIDFPGEAAGRLRHWQSWRKIDHATIAFGQGVSVSAVQLITALSAIANDGVLMKPRIVRAVKNPDGSTLKRFAPEVRRQATSPAIAEKVRIMMRSVTDADGTGPQAAPAGYSVCGKTGTAQIINSDGTYQNCDYNALFMGFAPARAPELAVLVVVKAPHGSHYGGVVAAPAFREIIRESFNYMDVSPVESPQTATEKGGDLPA